MKILSKKVTMDEMSFQPMLELTIQLPLEPMMDGVLRKDLLASVLGTELINAFEAYQE